MIRYYLKEKPLLNNLTLLMTKKENRRLVEENFKEFVIKPVAESGGYGIVIGRVHQRLKKKTIKQIKKIPETLLHNPWHCYLLLLLLTKA